MSEPFLAEIRIMSFNFPPKGWALCNGQIMPINQNQALFSLLGTTYGGNGLNNFALPNLQGRVPVHAGSSIVLGEIAGEENHTLTNSEMPVHTHLASGSGDVGNAPFPTGALLAAEATPMYAPTITNSAPVVTSTIVQAGGLPHSNMMPFLTLNFCIALVGIFPSRS